MHSTILQLKNIYYSYPDGEPVLSNISLDIHKSDLVIIKGESGAGKSTFLKLFNRFCDVHEGSILFNNKDLRHYHIEHLRSAVIYLPQLPLMIHGTIGDNLDFPFTFNSHKNRSFSPVEAQKWLDYFQLDYPLNHDAMKLSIGQRQRIALIRSLLLEPEVLLLDEPGSALDPNNRKLIEQKIQSLAREDRITAVMATHSDVSFDSRGCRFFNLEEKELRESDG